MSYAIVAVGAGTAIGGIASGIIGSRAANQAAGQQTAASMAAIAEQRRQFDSTQQLLSPYVQAGNGALTGQQNLLGLNGAGAQQTSIDALQNSPYFQSLLARGNDSILQNASATGGLRGGNTQAALGQFAPQLLGQFVDSQYNKLGGLVNTGLGAATQQAGYGQQTASNIGNLYGNIGSAQAGASLATGRAWQNGINSVAQGFGTYYGNKGGF